MTIYSAIQLGIDPTVGAVSALLVLFAAAAMALISSCCGGAVRMNAVEITGLAKNLPGGQTIGPVSLAVAQGEMLRFSVHPVRQDDGAAHDRRVRGADGRHHLSARRRHHADAGAPARGRADVPEFRAVSASEGVRNIAFGLRRRGWAAVRSRASTA